jgi:hypothetical protein
MLEIIEKLIILIMGITAILFRKPLGRYMLKTQLRIAKRRYKSSEKLEKIEQIGHPVFNIALIVIGTIFIIGSVLALLDVLKGN